MKRISIWLSTFLLLMNFLSCKKDSGTPGAPLGGTQLFRIQEGTDPATDTVFKIAYAGNNMSYIYDSIFDGGSGMPDTLFATYNSSGQLQKASFSQDIIVTYIYNSNGLLTEIDDNVLGENEIYQYTYVNGIISKKTWSSDLGQGGAPMLYLTYNYTLTGGNITEIKTYDNTNTLQSDIRLSYGAQTHSNTFKQLALLNVENILNLDNFEGFDNGSFDTYFDKNVLTGFNDGTSAATLTNTINEQILPSEIVSNVPSPFNGQYTGTFTWKFGYE